MPITYASWIHGQNVVITDDNANGPSVLSRNNVYFAQLRYMGTSFGFHYSIPTPTIISGKRLKIDKAMIRMRVAGDYQYYPDKKNFIAFDAHVYDGEKRILLARDQTLLEGKWKTLNFDLDRYTVTYGILLSIFLHGQLPFYRIDVSAVGADFYE